MWKYTARNHLYHLQALESNKGPFKLIPSSQNIYVFTIYYTPKSLQCTWFKTGNHLCGSLEGGV